AAPPQCRAIEEPQRAHLHPYGIGRQTAGHKVEMIVPQMLDPELIGRSPVESAELRYRTDVSLLGAWRQIAHRHVVDHALAQRRDRLDHRKFLSNWGGPKGESLQTAGSLPMTHLRLR